MKRILLVEDEELIAELVQRKLQDEGYYVFVARDGEDALKQIRERRPDLILLDMILPRLNGFDVLAELEKDEGVKLIPVIIISNSGESEEIKRAKAAGVRDWLVKTDFDLKEMVEKVRRQIGSAQ